LFRRMELPSLFPYTTLFRSARGTVPLAIFGPDNYGYRLGLLGAPARMAQAAAPLLFGLLIERYGVGVLAASVALSLCGFVALLGDRKSTRLNSSHVKISYAV